MRLQPRLSEKQQSRQSQSGGHLRLFLWAIALVWLGIAPSQAATVSLYSNNFDSYTASATNLADVADADPVGTEWNLADDTALNPTTAGAGVQVIDWLAHSGGKSLLLRSG